MMSSNATIDLTQLPKLFREQIVSERPKFLASIVAPMSNGLAHVNDIEALYAVDPESVEKGLDQAIEENPSNLTAARILIWLFIRKVEYDKADSIFSKVSPGWKDYSELYIENLRTVFLRRRPETKAIFQRLKRHFKNQQAFNSYFLQSIVATDAEVDNLTESFILDGKEACFNLLSNSDKSSTPDNQSGLWKCVEDLLNANTVALVGNSPIMIGKSLGSEIDRHDIVVRCNFPNISDFVTDVGSKTDLMVFNESVRSRHRDRLTPGYNGARCLGLHPEPSFNLEEALSSSSDRVSTLPPQARKFLSSICYARSTTGLMAIVFLTVVLGRKVSIYGFDFFSGLQPHYYDKQVGAYLGHELEYEKWYVQTFLTAILPNALLVRN